MSIHRNNPEGQADDADLERILARQPFRSPPAEWRDAILRGATELGGAPRWSRSRREVPRTRSWWAGLGGVWDRWASGWTMAAAAWVVILALEQFAASPTESGAQPRAPLSSSALATLREQQRELLGQLTATTSPEPPSVPPAERPRAARDDEGGLIPVAGDRRGLPFVGSFPRSSSKLEPSTPC